MIGFLLSKVWTSIDIVRWGADYFRQKGVDSPRLTIELLLCKVMNIGRVEIYSNFDTPLKQEELAVLRDYVIRRGKREPLQYIIGDVDFLGYRIEVDPSVLIPRPETEMLANIILKSDIILKSIDDKTRALDILDIGTGSGCIAIALAKSLPNATITAADKFDAALKVAAGNAELNNTTNIKFIKNDILIDVPPGQYDLIVSNPPYVSEADFASLQPEIVDFEPRHSVTDNDNGLMFYRRFARIFGSLLSEDGRFWLEIGAGQDEEISSIFDSSGFVTKSFKDLSNTVRFVSGEKAGY